jgi:hypothetical protein
MWFGWRKIIIRTMRMCPNERVGMFGKFDEGRRWGPRKQHMNVCDCALGFGHEKDEREIKGSGCVSLTHKGKIIHKRVTRMGKGEERGRGACPARTSTHAHTLWLPRL